MSYSPGMRSWRSTIKGESRRVIGGAIGAEELNVITRQVGIKTSAGIGLLVLVVSWFCVLFSVHNACGQFGDEGSSGLKVPIPMGLFGSGDGKETRSLALESVLQKNFIADQLAVDGNMVYWVNRGGSSALRYGKLRAGDLAAEGTLSKNYNGQLLTVDQGLLYWVDPAARTIQQAEIGDGELRNVKTIADNINVKMLAADSGNLYWQEGGNQELLVGRVVDGKLQREKVVDKIFRAREFSIDRGVLYWVDRNTRALHSKKLGDDKDQAPVYLSSNFTGKMLVVENSTFFWVPPGIDELCYGRVH